MAESATASFGNSKIDGYYQSFLKTLPNEQISYDPVQYEEQTVDSITGQVEKYLRNYYDKAITQRQAQTVRNNAELDVDAVSRGMSSSTFLSDMKNRQYMAESADIAGLNSDYNATLAQTVQDQYNQYLANKLNVDFTNRQNQLTVDQWNASARLALEELAYQRALESYQRKGSGGSGPNNVYTLGFSADGKHLVYRDTYGNEISAVPASAQTSGVNPDYYWSPQKDTGFTYQKPVSTATKKVAANSHGVTEVQ